MLSADKHARLPALCREIVDNDRMIADIAARPVADLSLYRGLIVRRRELARWAERTFGRGRGGTAKA